ncbi:arabinosyltransferase C-terminal domain-containing protein [Saccharomonospora saliphila]|uniref:arabinosyltransferase C-terminal domain-containing protein n=1 Tax=Saccharomonospora saliphila TaxID=369829 RepID=UPI001E2BFFE0|nr:arabinosyltransferase C-terminal domain-containing protein [Saccharomonospora saliphila]
MAVAMVSRSGTYNVAGSTIAGLGGGCGVEDWLTVEPEVAAGVLTADGPPARLDGFAVNGGFGDHVGDDARAGVPGGSATGPGLRTASSDEEDTAPPEPYGTAEVPAWGSGGAEGGLTTAWYALPARSGSPDAPPLVIPVGGTGAVSATVQFADADGVVLTEHRLRLPTGTWREARLDPAGAARVRVVAEDERDGAGWVAVGTPRLPEVVALTEHVPVHEPVLLDWVDAFFLPCRRPASVAGGVTEPVRYRIASGPGDRWLTGMSFSRDTGGPYAPLLDIAEQTPVPTYLRGDKLREPISVLRLDYPVPVLEAAQR